MGRTVRTKRIRVNWGNINVVKTFLDACIHEVTINGRDGHCLKEMSWTKVGEILKATHNFSVDHKQLKNYLNGLKGKYRVWLSLKKKTGNKYDPSTNMFNLTDEEWETESKGKKIIGTLKNSPLWFPDLCAQLFNPRSLVSPSSSNDPVKNKHKMGDITHEAPMVEVPPVLPQVQPAIETKAEVKYLMNLKQRYLLFRHQPKHHRP